MITQKSKEGMLKYLVGDYGEQPVIDNTPEITSLSNFDKNISSIIRDNLDALSYAYNVLYYNEYIVIYGNTTKTQAGGGAVGYIILLDQQFNTLEVWTQLPSGGDLYPIYSMNIDETGQFYAVTLDTTPSASETKRNDQRLVLFNNFTLNTGGDYQLRIRKTYLLNTQDYASTGKSSCILKSEKEATYYIMRIKTEGDTQHLDDCVVTRVKINVGSENEWTNFKVPNSGSFTNAIAKIIPDGSEENYYYMVLEDSGGNTSALQYKLGTDTIVLDKTVSLNGSFGFTNFISMGIILDKNTAYLSLKNSSTNNPYIFEIENNVPYVIFTERMHSDYTYDTANPLLSVYQKNELIFAKYTQNFYNQATQTANYINKIGVIVKKNIMWGEENQSSGLAGEMCPLVIANEYNLYKVYSQFGTAQDGTYRYQIVYNSTNYNGEPYDYYEINKPTQLILKSEESNPELLYARNLYNMVTQNNTVTSTAQIPYKLLNGTQIGYQGLIGATNVIMNNEYQTIEKNIFEQLNINIANTWTIINENDPTNHIINQEASNQLVANASQGNYKGAEHIGYYDIIYTDGTQSVKNSIVSKIKLSSTRYRLVFGITVTKQIDRIEITNQYEDTDKLVYVSIDGSSFEIGKSYQISQRVRVDETADGNVVYNNQNVLYNGNQVIY